MRRTPGVIRIPRLSATVIRSAGTLTAVAILVFALFTAVAVALNTRNAVQASFEEQSRIQEGQLALERMLKIQLDEENYLRAYVITHDPSYIASYQATTQKFNVERAGLTAVLTQEDLAEPRAALLDY